MTSRYGELLNRGRESSEYWATQAVIEFTHELEQLMDKHDLSKVDLAKAIESVPSYITKVLSGDANFTIRTMSKLLHPFGYTLHIGVAPRRHRVLFASYAGSVSEVVASGSHGIGLEFSGSAPASTHQIVVAG